MTDIARSILHSSGRKAFRLLRAIVSPAVNLAKSSKRERERLAIPLDREALASRINGQSSLEIGPFFTPLLVGANVSYFDVLDEEALRKRAIHVGGTADTVPKIEFVSPIGDLSIVDRKFETILSAHVIEHQPDLVKHLLDVAAILQPGGAYWLIVPDRRFSFDFGLPESSFDDVAEAHYEGRAVHTVENVEMHLTRTVHNNALLHWLGWHGKGRKASDFQEQATAEMKRAANGEYVDVHAWIFSPISFRVILTRLHDEGLTKFQIETITDTAFGKLEFFACLRLPA